MNFKQGMLIKKKIALKNGKHASLEFYLLPEIFSIYALDDKENVVGQLSFEILRKFVHTFSKEECQNEAISLENYLSMLKGEDEIDVTQSNQDKFDIKGDILMKNGKEYHLKRSVAYLNLIEIKDENFFQVGLGSAMHKEMEDFVRANGCDEIRIFSYYPFGPFQSGTRAFYEHSGYVFDYSNGIKVDKPLTKKLDLDKMTSLQILPGKSCNSSTGTPINEKYIQEKKMAD